MDGIVRIFPDGTAKFKGRNLLTLELHPAPELMIEGCASGVDCACDPEIQVHVQDSVDPSEYTISEMTNPCVVVSHKSKLDGEDSVQAVRMSVLHSPLAK